jgi:hypothetical protein
LSIDLETAAHFFRRLGFPNVRRAGVAERVRNSLEFRSLCPAWPASAEPPFLFLAPSPDEM